MPEIHLTHKRLHEMTSTEDHCATGLTAGDVLTATGADSFGWVAPASGGGGGGANIALSNLAAVAVNSSLAPGTDNAADLGAAATRWRDAYLAGTLSLQVLCYGSVVDNGNTQ